MFPSKLFFHDYIFKHESHIWLKIQKRYLNFIVNKYKRKKLTYEKKLYLSPMSVFQVDNGGVN